MTSRRAAGAQAGSTRSADAETAQQYTTTRNDEAHQVGRYRAGLEYYVLQIASAMIGAGYRARNPYRPVCPALGEDLNGSLGKEHRSRW